MRNEEVLNTACRRVQEAVDVANRAGIAPSDVVAPYCGETVVTGTDGAGRDAADLTWCGIPVVVDNETSELFAMSKPDDDPLQEPTFLVTQSTVSLVPQDFERYQPSLENMVEHWHEAKKTFTSKREADQD